MSITDELRKMTDELDKGMEELGWVRRAVREWVRERYGREVTFA